MAEPSPTARSPIVQALPLGSLDGWEISRRKSSAALRLLDLTACIKLLFRGPKPLALSEFLPPFGQARRVPSGPLIIATIPDQWLLVGAPGAASSIRTWLSSNINGSPLILTDLTHARVLLRLVGMQSARLLSKVCAINFGAAVFPGGTAIRSSLAEMPCEIIRDDITCRPGAGPPDSTRVPSYLIICDRPAGAYIFDALMDAGGEYNIDIDGFSFE